MQNNSSGWLRRVHLTIDASTARLARLRRVIGSDGAARARARRWSSDGVGHSPSFSVTPGHATAPAGLLERGQFLPPAPPGAPRRLPLISQQCRDPLLCRGEAISRLSPLGTFLVEAVTQIDDLVLCIGQTSFGGS